jgi:hypothetical protein
MKIYFVVFLWVIFRGNQIIYCTNNKNQTSSIKTFFFSLMVLVAVTDLWVVVVGCRFYYRCFACLLIKWGKKKKKFREFYWGYYIHFIILCYPFNSNWNVTKYPFFSFTTFLPFCAKQMDSKGKCTQLVYAVFAD